MSSESRSPSVEADHSDDRSYNSNDSAGSDHHWFSSREPSNSTSLRDSPRSGNGNQSVRAISGAEADLLASEPPAAERDGSNDARELSIDEEVKDQTALVETGFHSIFNAEEIKIERTFDDEAIVNAHPGLFRPSSSSIPRGSLVDEPIDCLVSGMWRAGSSRPKKARYTKGQAPKRTVNKRGSREVSSHPGSTLCTESSLESLRRCFHISEGVELILPSSHQRADDPPAGCMTLYESYFYNTFLWFPIPSLIFHFLGKYGLAIGQLLPRGMRHLIGLIVLSYEAGIPLGVRHLQNLLEFRRSGKSLRYYISNKKNRKVIDGFPNKDGGWEKKYFFVPINGASVGNTRKKFIKETWQQIDRKLVLRCPSDLLEFLEYSRELELHWERDFTLERVEKARAQAYDSFDSSDSAPEEVLDLPESFNTMPQKSIRELLREQREEKEAKRKAETTNRRTDQTPLQSKVEGKKVAVDGAEKRVVVRKQPTDVGKAVKIARAAMDKASKAKAPPPSSSPARSNASRDSGALVLNRRKKKTSDLPGEPSKNVPSEAGRSKRAPPGELSEPALKKAKRDPSSVTQLDPAEYRSLQKAEAANFLANSTPGVRLPPSHTLLEAEAYAEVASNMALLSESLNRVVEGYETRARSGQAALDELQKCTDDLKRIHESELTAKAMELKRAEEENAKLKAEAAKQREEAAKHHAEAVKVTGVNRGLVEKKRSLEAQIAQLQGQVKTMDASFDVEVRKAKCKLNSRYAHLFETIRPRLEGLGEVHARAVRLAQAQGNIGLINDMRSDNPPDLDVELADLQEYVASDPEATEEAGALLGDVIRRLVAFPDPPSIPEVHTKDETITWYERLSLGIGSQWGSNAESPMFQNGVEKVVIVEPVSVDVAPESAGQIQVDPVGAGESEGQIAVPEAPARDLDVSEKTGESSLRLEGVVVEAAPVIQKSPSSLRH